MNRCVKCDNTWLNTNPSENAEAIELTPHYITLLSTDKLQQILLPREERYDITHTDNKQACILQKNEEHMNMGTMNITFNHHHG